MQDPLRRGFGSRKETCMSSQGCLRSCPACGPRADVLATSMAASLARAQEYTIGNRVVADYFANS
jgi:hypothetical protein